ncbi:enoyl-CoA hydratase [Nocardioides flavus (ex Wang et al. 2016)]|uniref:Enoyl-CoA hydratase n=1 Tax=Nocardioides flavus (ex Wang et al. 2016) TaxID=2058780 RepID=A0ABQ3HJ87_9ACTN|nr:enoyl-CoA hydratase/isomerase family protein [Nocardioides flavus (ex Wang et al. 2016)]GHE17720.1 enoyl-CoA hydratase [Nocardioides flavus (ex Wang et al. 2016)]
MPQPVSAPGRHDLVRRQSHEGVAVLTLSRAERHNALVPELLEQLRTEVATVAADPGVRAVVLSADGPSFSTGGDVAAFASREGTELETYARRIVGVLHEAVLDLLALDVPLVVAVQGPVTGGSLGLVLAADVVVAGPRASFAPWYVRVGFSPDGGWTALLPRRVGHARAATWQLTNRTVEVDLAAQWGLVDETADDPRARALEVARDLARMVPGAVTRTKRLMRSDLDDVRRGLDAELEEFVAQIGTDEARAGMQAFLGHRAQEQA